MEESTLAGGPGGAGELADGGGAAAAFGDLPPHLRERILQARRAGFPTRYEKLLEDYYRRLARGSLEAAAPGAAAAPGDGTPGGDR